ncbi:hypothetical protein ACIPRI_09840 [Variovorax sp. LARHSF232]
MGWLYVWLIFGLLTAYEAGELAMHAGGDWAPVRALAYLAGSVTGLGVIALAAVRHARPGKLGLLMAISLLALVLCLWGLYGRGHSAGWVATALFGVVYLLACLALGGVAMFLAWRRQRANDERTALAKVERERHGRLERMRAEAAATLDDPLGPDSDFVLPARPKWEEN